MVTLYQPTEYEQMLIAAGWVAVETVDPVYLEYLNRIPNRYDAMSYEDWQYTLEQWEKASTEYNKEIEPLLAALEPGRTLSFTQEARQRELMHKLSWYEEALGY